MAYNDPSNLTSLTGLFQYLGAEEAAFGSVILLFVWAVLFFAMKESFTTAPALSGSTFVVAIAAIILRILDVIGNFPMIVSIIAVMVSVMYLMFQEE